MSKFRLAHAAKRDLENIWDYIAADNPGAADSLIELLIEKFQLLAGEPEIGRERPEIKKGIRSLPVKKYVVFYRHTRDQVEIVRVMSGYRDVIKSFQQE